MGSRIRERNWFLSWFAPREPPRGYTRLPASLEIVRCRVTNIDDIDIELQF